MPTAPTQAAPITATNHRASGGDTSKSAKTHTAATVTCPLGKLLSVYRIRCARSGRSRSDFSSCARAAATPISTTATAVRRKTRRLSPVTHTASNVTANTTAAGTRNGTGTSPDARVKVGSKYDSSQWSAACPLVVRTRMTYVRPVAAASSAATNNREQMVRAEVLTPTTVQSEHPHSAAVVS